MQRGKNDEADAKRIAVYAMRYQDRCIAWTPPAQIQSAINDLLRLRDRLITAKNMLMVPVKELKATGEVDRAKLVENSSHKALKGIECEIDQIEKKIDALLKKDGSYSQNINLITTVPGVGKWTALSFMMATNNFSRKMNSRQLACYCGCAPFVHQSGTSVRGKTRVSHMANKTLKKLLTLCASSLIRMKNELGDYYRRKVAEGKNKMCVINALRNKIITRICSVVERQTPYIPSITTS
jgi:transposase